MSFLDDLIDIGSGALKFISGNNLGSQLARTAITGYALNQLYKSINPTNGGQNVDPGVRLQVDASTDNSIPIVYGTAWLGGIITDAILTNNNGTMYYCLTLCEQTGNTNLGSGPGSSFSFGEIYRDDMRLIFNTDGITVSSQVDRDGTICTKPAGKIKVWCFNGNSVSPVLPSNYSGTPTQTATQIFPGWAASGNKNANTMDNLIFAIIRVDYDATNDIRGLGTFKFQIKNSMSLPGDVLYDYMTNTRYGAGIPPGSIYLS